MFRYLIHTLSVVVAVVAAPAMALTERVALVIGNSAYEHTAALANPRNDASAMAAKLRSLGFTTVEGYDLTKMEMAEKAREFARESRDAELALFFYAGHAMEVDGRNYLVPVEASLRDELSIDFETFPVDVITRQMSYTDGANLIFLDACRDNPLAEALSRTMNGSTRSLGATPGALAQMEVNHGALGTGIAFATEPGRVAADGDGQHSPFTEALLRHIGAPNTPITSVMNRVTGDVWEASSQTQRPWFNQSFTADIVLNPVAEVPVAAEPAAPAPAETAAAPAPASDDERFMFEIARESGLAADYQAYLDFYPQGRYAPFARNMIERLRMAKAAAEVPTAPTTPAETAPALAATAAGAAGTRTVYAGPAYNPAAPLVLAATPVLQSMAATDVTEQALQLDRSKRREIQARLNATGNNTGTPDGVFGPKSRNGVRGWQVSNGLPATGFLNGPQLDLLTVQTEATYAAFLTAPRQTTSSRASSSSRTSSSRTKTPEVVNEFINGFGRGAGNALGNKIFGN